MTDSLLVDGQIELIGTIQSTGQPVASQIPGAVGAGFWLGTGYDLGAPQTVIDVMASVFYSAGESIIGQRVSNRVVKLPVNISAPDRLTLSYARELLLSLVSRETWELIYTRDGGSPMILECLSARPSDVVYDLNDERQYFCQLTLNFEAMPFGRSDKQQQLYFASPAIGTFAPPLPLSVDTCEAVNAGANPNWATSGAHIEGSKSLLYNVESLWGQHADVARYDNNYGSNKDFTNRTVLQFWAGFGSYTYYKNWAYTSPGSVYFACELYDSGGHKLAFGKTVTVRQSNHMYTPKWSQISIPIPQGVAGFVYSQVVRYMIRASNRSDLSLWNTDFSLDAVYAVAPTTQITGLVRGAVYNLNGVLGTAPTPLNLMLQRPILNPNPTFQDNVGAGSLTGWTGVNGSLALSQAQVNLYGWSALLTVTSSATAPAIAGTAGTFAVTVGSVYVVRAWVYSSATSVQIGVDWQNSSHTFLSTSVTSVTVTAGTWTPITSANLTAPANAAYAFVRVGFAAGVAVGSTLYAQNAAAYPIPATTKTMLVHSPSQEVPTSFNPYMQLGTGASPYVPGAELTVPSSVASQSSRFGGTFTILLVAYTWNTPASTRTITIQFKEYEFPGASPTITTISRIVTPSTDFVTFLSMGEITIPFKDVPDDNTMWYMTATVQDTNASDRFLDLMFIDTMGQTVYVDETNAYAEFYIDAPPADRDIGRISESQYNRSAAISALDDNTVVSGGPMTANPGDNQLFAYSFDGAPALTASYYARYWIDRTDN